MKVIVAVECYQDIRINLGVFSDQEKAYNFIRGYFKDTYDNYEKDYILIGKENEFKLMHTKTGQNLSLVIFQFHEIDSAVY